MAVVAADAVVECRRTDSADLSAFGKLHEMVSTDVVQMWAGVARRSYAGLYLDTKTVTPIGTARLQVHVCRINGAAGWRRGHWRFLRPRRQIDPRWLGSFVSDVSTEAGRFFNPFDRDDGPPL
jgi:hypothetical protein